MRYFLSQAELIQAVEHWLNTKKLAQAVKVLNVSVDEKSSRHGKGGVTDVLHVIVEDDQGSDQTP